MESVTKKEINAPLEKWEHLLAEAKQAMSKGEDAEISPSKIRPMPNQPRVYFSEESIRRLAHSMESVGQIQRGIIRRVKVDGEIEYEILDGERRWRSAIVAELNYRATIVEVSDEAVPFIIAAVANFNRENHTPTEVADSIDRMMQIGIPMEEIANILGISLHWAYQMHGLIKLTPEVREMLDPNQPKKDILPVTAAIHISKAHPDLQVELAQGVKEKRFSLATLRQEVVRASQNKGHHVRTRRREPRKILSIIESQSRQVLRVVNDFENYLKSEEAQAVLKTRSPEEILTLRNRITMARAKTGRINELFIASRQTLGFVETSGPSVTLIRLLMAFFCTETP